VLPPPGEGTVLPRLLTLACLLVDLMGSYRLSPGENAWHLLRLHLDSAELPSGTARAAHWSQTTMCLACANLCCAEQQKRAADARTKLEAAARAGEQVSRASCGCCWKAQCYFQRLSVALARAHPAFRAGSTTAAGWLFARVRLRLLGLKEQACGCVVRVGPVMPAS